MKRKWRAAAVIAVAAVALAVATAAVMFARPTGGDRKTTDNHIIREKVLEMLFCVPGMDCEEAT